MSQHLARTGQHVDVAAEVDLVSQSSTVLDIVQCASVPILFVQVNGEEVQRPYTLIVMPRNTKTESFGVDHLTLPRNTKTEHAHRRMQAQRSNCHYDEDYNDYKHKYY